MTRIAIVGVGKIARDQHIPHIAANPALQLTAVVSLSDADVGVPSFRTIDEMAAARLGVEAIAICTPPIGRLALVQSAFANGLDVLMEKPPAATLTEAEGIAALAKSSERLLFTSWHARHAPAVEPARDWLAKRSIRAVRVNWLEDVRQWHPGQAWVWQPGIGVFDPGINALSTITRILPWPLRVESSTLRFPSNKPAPIAASIAMKGGGDVPVAVEFNWDQRGPQTWSIAVDTDQGTLELSDGASHMAVDGKPVAVGNEEEYANLYRHFVDLIAARRSDVDLTPFRLVADCFLLGQRSEVAPFTDF